MVLSMYIHISGRTAGRGDPSPNLEPSVKTLCRSLKAVRQSAQCADPGVPDSRSRSLLRLSPGAPRSHYRSMTLFCGGNDARASIVARTDDNPTLVFDYREIAGQRCSFEAEELGQLADFRRPAQDKHDQNRELRHANSMGTKLPIEGARQAAGGAPRGQTQTVPAFEEALIASHIYMCSYT
jgi:hypothetical protein